MRNYERILSNHKIVYVYIYIFKTKKKKKPKKLFEHHRLKKTVHFYRLNQLHAIRSRRSKTETNRINEKNCEN